MNGSYSSCSTAAWIPALALALSIGMPSKAQADTPVFLWGFQRACERMTDIDRIIERQLFDEHRNVALLKSPTGKPLPACTGERCAQAFRAACPNAKGRILGGQGIQGKPTRTRLWLYDLESGQIAYQDEYCHTCNVIGALSEHSRALIDHPHFGPAPGPAPGYCASNARASARSPVQAQKGPVFLEVYGDGKHKAPVYAALRGQLEALGRTALPIPVEAKDHSTEEMDRIVAGQQAAQVLSVLVQKAGTVTVQLYDQRARVTDADEVNCPECGAEPLISKIKDVVSNLLNRCAGSQCAELALSGAVETPVAACDAFPTNSCASSELDALLEPKATMINGGGLDPKTARAIKGLAWGGFAAASATAIGLAAANPYTVEQINGRPVNHALTDVAWAFTASSAVLLGIAVPLTIMVNRAQRTLSTAAPSGVAASALIQCPN